MPSSAPGNSVEDQITAQASGVFEDAVAAGAARRAAITQAQRLQTGGELVEVLVKRVRTRPIGEPASPVWQARPVALPPAGGIRVLGSAAARVSETGHRPPEVAEECTPSGIRNRRSTCYPRHAERHV
ncbi:hypothetical protein [Nocardia gipuzkoensis]